MFFLVKAVMNIYENIKEIADHKGLSIRQLEHKTGLSDGAIRKWEKHSPSVDNLLKVSKVLKVRISRLLK